MISLSISIRLALDLYVWFLLVLTVNPLTRAMKWWGVLWRWWLVLTDWVWLDHHVFCLDFFSVIMCFVWTFFRSSCALFGLLYYFDRIAAYLMFISCNIFFYQWSLRLKKKKLTHCRKCELDSDGYMELKEQWFSDGIAFHFLQSKIYILRSSGRYSSCSTNYMFKRKG